MCELHSLKLCRPITGKPERIPPSGNPRPSVLEGVPDPCKATLDAAMLGKKTVLPSQKDILSVNPIYLCTAVISPALFPRRSSA